MSSLLGKADFACNFSARIAYFLQFFIAKVAYFLQYLIATLSFQRNVLASYHVKTFTNNSLSLCIFRMKMLQHVSRHNTQHIDNYISVHWKDMTRTNRAYLCASRQSQFEIVPIR